MKILRGLENCQGVGVGKFKGGKFKKFLGGGLKIFQGGGVIFFLEWLGFF